MQHTIMEDPLFIVIDLFCGAGGTTTGFTKAMYVNQQGRLCKAVKVIACVNHDRKAIKSHWSNHPEVVHFEEDIRTLDLTKLTELVNYYRELYQHAYILLWASLECTNFSKAKGGQPRDADSRTLADHLDRYVVALDPDYIQIENVVEFMSWGPLRIKAKKTHADRSDLAIGKNKITHKLEYLWIPFSRKNGKDWLRWRKFICSHGYRDEWKELNSADFGAHTARNRLFGCFAKRSLPIVWPTATHAKKPVKADLFDSGLERWKAVKEVLDFSDHGYTIFNRKKPLSPKTLARIYAGLVKYVAGGEDGFVTKFFSGKPEGKNTSFESPAGTITTVANQGVVKAFFVRYNGKGETESVHLPLGTITRKDRFALMQPICFIDKQYGGNDRNHQPVDNPAGTITGNPKLNLVRTEPFIMPTNFDNGPQSIENPLQTITANRKWHYIVNPSHGGNLSSVDNPSPVIIARQDKAPLYLITTSEGSYTIPVYECDCEQMVKIKQFMAEHGLVDIKMRMIRVDELLRIQGFPEDYKLVGSQADQKKFIGNSVVPHVVTAWAEAMCGRILEKMVA